MNSANQPAIVQKDKSSDVFHINRYSIARFLLAHKKPDDSHFTLQKKSPDDYIVHLENAATWAEYKKEIEHKIELLKNEDDSLRHIFKEFIEDDDIYLKNKYDRRMEIQKQLKEAFQEQEDFNTINRFIENDALQEKLLIEDELHAHQAKASKDETDEENLPLMYSEATFESSASAIEVNQRVHEFIQNLHAISANSGDAATSDHAGLGAAEVGTTASHTIPIVSDFVRGLNALREAYTAYRDPHTPDRKTKMATGIFAGVVSIGAGIVGSLLLAGAGLLAGAAAVFAAPIVIAAAIVGVYSAALYRDHQIVQSATKELATAEKLLHHLETDFAHETENVITREINALNEKDFPPEVIAVKDKEAKIKSLTAELQKAEEHHASDSEIHMIKDQLHSAYHDRNNKISQCKILKKNIVNKLQSNSRLARISVQKNRLSQSIGQLKIAKDSAKKKRIWSALCLVGVCLALTAVCLTGIGALVVGAVAATALVVGSVARAYQANKDKQKVATHHKKIKENLHEQHHSSLYDVDYRLLHGKKDAMIGTLVRQQADLAREIPKKPQEAAPTVTSSNVKQEPAATESNDSPPKIKHP